MSDIELHIIGGSRFEGLSNNEIVDCLDREERAAVRRLESGDGCSPQERLECLSKIAIDLFADSQQPTVE